MCNDNNFYYDEPFYVAILQGTFLHFEYDEALDDHVLWAKLIKRIKMYHFVVYTYTQLCPCGRARL